MATVADWIRALPGKSAAEVASFIGCSPKLVTVIRRQDRNRERVRHIKRVAYHNTKVLQAEEIPWTSEHIKFLRDNWSTMTGNEIARKLGRSRSGIVGKANRLGLKK